MKYNLADICEYAKGKVDVAILDDETYISTENMMPNKGGITSASSLPTIAQTQVFLAGDVLVSNIRPYFKKIWFAEFDGGCSNDVLVFRAKDGVSKRFLYYVLSDDTFFDYSMATSKGTKMPRGDKAAIMKYEVPDFTYEEQEKIAGVLEALDRKIQLNTEINENLLQQAIALYEHLIQNAEWPTATILDVAEKVAMGPFGSNIKVSTFVPEGVPIISGNHLRGYFLEEPEFNYITEEHAERLKNSIVYDRYVLSQRQFYLRCDETKVVPEFLLMFFHSASGQHELLSYGESVLFVCKPRHIREKVSYTAPFPR